MPKPPRVGVWLTGGRGSVATTAIVGSLAVGAGVAPDTGMVTAHPPFSTGPPLVPLDALVFGGHDLADTALLKRAEDLVHDGVIPGHVVPAVADRLTAIDGEILLAPSPDRHPSPRAALGEVEAALESFTRRHQLDMTVVVNVTSTEPPATWDAPPRNGAELDAILDAGWEVCPVSVVYATAALRASCPYVDFTPAAATRVPALVDLATERGIPMAGRDGKTGETLLKSVLAPMFADRALRVLSWSGTNLLGGGDGRRLADERFASAKKETKGLTTGSILPYDMTTQVHIDHVPDLGEWKTAWDHIHFEGFLGTRMVLQLTWQGCDSTLAAPLVIDLVRLMSLARRRRLGGLIPELGFFFKDPVGSDEHRLAAQFDTLCAWYAAP